MNITYKKLRHLRVYEYFFLYIGSSYMLILNI